MVMHIYMHKWITGIYNITTIVLLSVDFSSGKYVDSILNFRQLGLQCGPPVSLLQCVIRDRHCLQVMSEGSVACNKERESKKEGGKEVGAKWSSSDS